MSGWFGQGKKKSPKPGMVSSGSVEQPGSPKTDLKLEGGGQGLHNPLAWDSVPSSLKEKFPHWKERTPLAVELHSHTCSEGKLTCTLYKSAGEQPDYTIPYVVMEKDTLNGIAIKFETTPTELARLNRKSLAIFTIFDGDVLYVPDHDKIPCSVPPKSIHPGVIQAQLRTSTNSQDTIFNSSCTNPLPDVQTVLCNDWVVGKGKEGVEDIEVFSPPSSPPSIVDSSKNFVEEVMETHIMLKSKYMSDDQGCVRGNLVLNQTVMMFSPFRDDPIVKEHGFSMFEVMIPLQDILFAAITRDVAPPPRKSAVISGERGGGVGENHVDGDSSELLGGDERIMKAEARDVLSDTLGQEEKQTAGLVCIEGGDEKGGLGGSVERGEEGGEEGGVEGGEGGGVERGWEGGEEGGVERGEEGGVERGEEGGVERGEEGGVERGEEGGVEGEGRDSKHIHCDQQQQYQHQGESREVGGGEDEVMLKEIANEEEKVECLDSPSSDVSGLLVIESSSEKLTSSHHDSEISIDSLFSDHAYFLHVRVSHKSCAAYAYTPLNRPVGIDIPYNSFLSSKNNLVQQVKTVFCFAIAERRIGDLVLFFAKNHPSMADQPVPSSPNDPSSWSEGCYHIMAHEGYSNYEDLLFSDDHFKSSSSESWEVYSLKDITKYRQRIERMEVEPTLPLPILTEKSSLMEDMHLKALANHLPSAAVGHDWCLIYSTFVHGISLRTLYRNMAGWDSPVVLLVKDNQNKLFGAAVTCPLKLSETFLGTGESFLFSFQSPDPEISIYHWTGENSYIVKGSNDGIYVGCGDGHTGLWLDEYLLNGTSQACSTFGNKCLSTNEEFTCTGLEAWGFL